MQGESGMQGEGGVHGESEVQGEVGRRGRVGVARGREPASRSRAGRRTLPHSWGGAAPRGVYRRGLADGLGAGCCTAPPSVRCDSGARTGGAVPAGPQKATFYTVGPKTPTVILKRLLDLL